MRHKKEDKQSSTHIVLYLPKPTIAILFGSREEVQISLKLALSTKYQFFIRILIDNSEIDRLSDRKLSSTN